MLLWAYLPNGYSQNDEVSLHNCSTPHHPANCPHWSVFQLIRPAQALRHLTQNATIIILRALQGHAQGRPLLRTMIIHTNTNHTHVHYVYRSSQIITDHHRSSSDHHQIIIPISLNTHTIYTLLLG